uniref:SJCHGC04296 protein n=1 Tax=Schistosoma japonicum TaxID=6182 RepID=Q5DAU4_SCHJA|nr:SJCHGC04296 protein [Schistosoma japonicum]
MLFVLCSFRSIILLLNYLLFITFSSQRISRKVFEKIMKHSKKLKQQSDLSQSKVENMTCNKPKNIDANDVIVLENSITNYQSASVYLNIFSTQNNYLIELKKKIREFG